MFGGVYFVTPLLAPLPAEAIWSTRALLTVPIVTAALLAMGAWGLVAEIGRRIRRRPALLGSVVLAGALLAAQLWVFGWAPLNGRALQVALGYFLLPLVLVVVGKFLYGDRMTWWQWLAAGIAAVGVVYEIVRMGGVSWETLLVALGYPAYFVLRRAIGIAHLGGMWWELVVTLPLAAIVMVFEFARGEAFTANPALWWAAPAFGLASGVAILLYILASRLLTMSLFGLLSYVEPALLVVASLLIGERIASSEWFTYGAIWSAVLVLVVGGALSIRRGAR